MIDPAPTLTLAQQLIGLRSVTPDDAGCLELLIARLSRLDFNIELIESNGVRNLWARRGNVRPLLVLAGHTDVVPTGPVERWASDPFVPTVRDGRMYGRGAADMKTSLAAFVVAIEEFVRTHPEHSGSIGVLFTSDEEGPALDGTVLVCTALAARGERFDYCIVGEPTSSHALGDIIKNGRRGSLSGRLIVKGIQGHVAYPHLARNPIHLVAPALAELASEAWDAGNEFFPASTFQVSNIHAGTGATNVIPGECQVDFNFRFSTASTPESLKTRVAAMLDRHNLDWNIEWVLGGEPFLTPPGSLSEAITGAIKSETGVDAELSTTGGTSDGRFIARICPQVVEFGPPNGSIHKVDENVELRFVEPLKNIYRRTLEALLLN
jgi:succinyl-diaminopimelate desuccinylase